MSPVLLALLAFLADGGTDLEPRVLCVKGQPGVCLRGGSDVPAVLAASALRSVVPGKAQRV